MLKLSTLLKETATNVALEMIKNGDFKKNIPEMPDFYVSRTSTCPKECVAVGKITVQKEVFHIFQLF